MKSLLVDTGCYVCKVYNYHYSQACSYKQSGILFWLVGLASYGMVLVYSLSKPCDPLCHLCLFDHTLWYTLIQLNSGSLACNFNNRKFVLIIWESNLGAFLLTGLLLLHLFITMLWISFYFCTCWVPIISVLNLVLSPCCTNLQLIRWTWTGILRQGVLGYVLPWLLFLRCYTIFHYSISQESP
jgi:hypothetical protein